MERLLSRIKFPFLFALAVFSAGHLFASDYAPVYDMADQRSQYRINKSLNNLGDISDDVASLKNSTAALAASIAQIQLSSIPTGGIILWPSASVPTGFFALDGSAINRTTYAVLFGLFGTTFGAGNGTTTFNLPNMQRRVAVGVGGSSGPNLSNTIGSTGGEETHTLVTSEMPSHTHVQQFENTSMVNGGGGGSSVLGRAVASAPETNPAVITQATGGGGAHNVLQPSIILNYIIKY